ncbi:MAG: MFS transporter [Gammaproteobacteria bacterium]|nr:MFS transporter [Gammaproteobacteria bacterium]
MSADTRTARLGFPGLDGQVFLTLAGAIGLTVANLGTWTMPMIIGTFVDSAGFSGLDAGFLASAEVGAMAAASLLTASLLGKLSPRTLALTGVAMVAVGHAITPQFHTVADIAICRAVAGFGGGMLYAAACATIARLGDGDRRFAIAMVMQGILIAGLLAMLPIAIDTHGANGLFLTLAGLSLLAVPVFARYSRITENPASTDAGSPAKGTAVPYYVAAMLMVPIALVATLEFSMWSQVERLGDRLGLSGQAIGLILSAGTVFGLLGGIAAAILGTRYGRLPPLLAGLTLQMLATVVCILAASPVPYVVAYFLWSAALFFVVPFLFGTASTLDSNGRWAAAASGMLLVGQMSGPALAGWVVHRNGYDGLLWMLVAVSIAAVAMLTVALRLAAGHSKE